MKCVLVALLSAIIIVSDVSCQDEIWNNLQTVEKNPEAQEFLDETEKAIKEKCGEAFEDVKKSKEEFQTCVSGLVDIETIQNEIEVSKKNGSMDEVFARYCKKRPVLQACLKQFTLQLERCLEDAEKETMKLLNNLTDTLIDFACYKDGDRVAMFIAEGGQQCLIDKKEELGGCFNKSIKNIIPSDLSFEKIPLIVIGDAECDEFTAFQQCTITVLETCKEKTPANLMEALFKYIRKILPCNKVSQVEAIDGPQNNFNRNKRNPSDTVTLKNQNMNLGRSIVDRIKIKCDKNAGFPQAFQYINGSFTELLMCIKHNMMRQASECPLIKRDVDLCLEGFLAHLKPCLSSKEDFLIPFIRESIAAGLKYICDNNGENLQRYKTTTGVQCITESNTQQFNLCLQSVTQKPVQDGEVLLKRDLLCKDLDLMKSCTNDHLKSHCSADVTFGKLVDGLLTEIVSPCSGNSVFLSSMIVGLWIVFYLQKLWP